MIGNAALLNPSLNQYTPSTAHLYYDLGISLFWLEPLVLPCLIFDVAIVIPLHVNDWTIKGRSSAILRSKPWTWEKWHEKSTYFSGAKLKHFYKAVGCLGREHLRRSTTVLIAEAPIEHRIFAELSNAINSANVVLVWADITTTHLVTSWSLA